MGAWRITKKDLTILARDRRTLVLLLAMPMILIGILGFSSGKLFTADSDARLELTIVNEDSSDLARSLIREFNQSPRIEATEVASLEIAEARVGRSNRAAIMVIGPGFSESAERLGLIDLLDFSRGRFSRGLGIFDIQVYPRSTVAWSRDAIEQLLFYKTLQVLGPHTLNRLALIKAYVDAYRAQHPVDSGAENLPLSGSLFTGLVPSSDAIYRYLVPSYAVMFAFFLINLMSYSFISERQSGTLLRIQAAPISTRDLVIGKTTPFLIISVVQGILLIASGRLLFGMSLGFRPWILLPVIVCTSVSATALGFLVAVLVRNAAQVSSFSTLLIIGLAAISGCLMPRSWMPELMQTVSLYVSPLSWSLIGYAEALSTNPTDSAAVLLCCVMLLLFSVAFFSVGLWRFSASPYRSR